MRLLRCHDSGDFCQLVEYRNGIPPYAILSHTWGNDEVTFQDFSDGTAQNRAGYDKVRFCALKARRRGLHYIWVDTCCINKQNSTELQEAINSMFRWYHNAACCFAYLADVDRSGARLHESRWFTRGWTLQELLAPANGVEFFSHEGVRLGDRQSLENEIRQATGLPVRAIRNFDPGDFSFRQRLAWMAGRTTKEEEDMVYALLGILDVSMPFIYGESRSRAENRLRMAVRDICRGGLILSPAMGGVGGMDFDCVAPEGTRVRKLALWSSRDAQHFQALRVTFSDGMEAAAGRPYGNNAFIEVEFQPDETIQHACLWENHDGNRFGAISLDTTHGQHVDFGHSRRGKTEANNPNPNRYVFRGFRGRAGRDIDRLMLVFGEDF